MYRIDNATAQPTRPTPLAPGPQPNGYFTGGSPGGPAPTRVDGDWLNAIQEELMNPVVLAGLTGDKTNNMQVLQALAAILAAPQQWVSTTQGIVAPAWANRIEFELTGAGGGGGYCQRSGSSTNYCSAGGGGAGGLIHATRPVTPGATLNFVAGVGGATDANGTSSSLTLTGQWSATCTGGQAPVWTQPGTSQGGFGGSGSFTGSVSSTGDSIQGGASGGDGAVGGVYMTTGHGGNGPYSGGGRAGNGGGLGGFASGAGGGGAYDEVGTGTKYNGGAGGNGLLRYRFLP